jgi:hypothetical protein
LPDSLSPDRYSLSAITWDRTRSPVSGPGPIGDAEVGLHQFNSDVIGQITTEMWLFETASDRTMTAGGDLP